MREGFNQFHKTYLESGGCLEKWNHNPKNSSLIPCNQSPFTTNIMMKLNELWKISFLVKKCYVKY